MPSLLAAAVAAGTTADVDDGAAATCGNCCLNSASSSSPGFCVLVLAKKAQLARGALRRGERIVPRHAKDARMRCASVRDGKANYERIAGLPLAKHVGVRVCACPETAAWSGGLQNEAAQSLNDPSCLLVAQSGRG